jgi:hypothetical protein
VSADGASRNQRCTSAKQVADFNGIPVVFRCEREEGHPGIHVANQDDPWKAFQW